jgi:hypothetical protein
MIDWFIFVHYLKIRFSILSMVITGMVLPNNGLKRKILYAYSPFWYIIHSRIEPDLDKIRFWGIILAKDADSSIYRILSLKNTG